MERALKVLIRQGYLFWVTYAGLPNGQTCAAECLQETCLESVRLSKSGRLTFEWRPAAMTR